MAKILFLSHRVPFPPNKGDKIRSFNEIKYLSSRHEIHLLAFCDYPEEVKYSEELKQYCRTVTLLPLIRWRQLFRAGFAMFHGRPWSIGYYSNLAMRQAVSEKMAAVPFDLIFVFCSSMAIYAARAAGIPKILDFVDSDARKWKQYFEARRPPINWLFGYEARKLSQLERRLIEEFDCSVFVSEREISHRTDKASNGKLAFIQNGIDLEFFKPSASAQSIPAIAFTGAMDYFPNVDGVKFFARSIFPKIRAVYPDARFVIVGSRPTAEVEKLATLPGITVTGTVKDVRSSLSQCQVAVVPLRIAQGIQNKILEALASGLPVVATPQATEGLAGIKDLPLALAADPDSFAKRVIEYISRAPLPDETVNACRQHLKNQYDWGHNLSALDRIINTLTQN